MAKKVLGLLFDIDGCVAGPGQQVKGKRNFEILHIMQNLNGPLLRAIKESYHEQKYDEVIVMCASARQNVLIDLVNGMLQNFPSLVRVLWCITAILRYQGINATLCPTLLGDVLTPGEDMQPDGATFDYLAKEEDTSDQEDSRLDLKRDYLKLSFMEKTTKNNLLYYLSQYLANKHPEAERLDLHYYDDRPDIVNPANNFFATNPQLLPSNVRLNTYVYPHNCNRLGAKTGYLKGDVVPSSKMINGTGKRHPNFRQVCRHISMSKFPEASTYSDALKMLLQDKDATSLYEYKVNPQESDVDSWVALGTQEPTLLPNCDMLPNINATNEVEINNLVSLIPFLPKKVQIQNLLSTYKSSTCSENKKRAIFKIEVALEYDENNDAWREELKEVKVTLCQHARFGSWLLNYTGLWRTSSNGARLVHELEKIPKLSSSGNTAGGGGGNDNAAAEQAAHNQYGGGTVS